MALNGYLLGLGSNLNPQHNMALMVAELMAHSDFFCISRVIDIPPVGMNSRRDFFNAVAYIETVLDPHQLKATCNEIETALGRDRTDPHSKLKDRPADIDILCVRQWRDIVQKSSSEITDEYFLYPVLDELKAFLADQPIPDIQRGVKIGSGDLSFGQTATTINRNARTGDKWVL